MSSFDKKVPPIKIKIYVDGFRIDNLEALQEEEDFREAAMTSKVKEFIEDREIVTIVAVPRIKPKFIIITTKL